MKLTFLVVVISCTLSVQAQFGSNQSTNRATDWSKEEAAQKKDTSKLNTKKIVQELALPKPLDILIDMSGQLVINTWNENKIKIETTVQFEGESELTDEQWFNQLGITMKLFGSTVRVKSKVNNTFSLTTAGNTLRSTYNGFSYFNSTSTGFQKITRQVILYIPASSNLEIENQRGKLKIAANIKSLLLNNTDGEVEVANIEKLQLRSARGSFTAGVITHGDIALMHDRLSVKQFNNGIIASSYSNIEIEKVETAKLASNTDDIDIDEVNDLSGIKNYGNLLINRLNEKLQLDGTSSDIKLRNISPSAEVISLFNRYADIRLPLQDIKTYSFEIKGSYNKIYSSFGESIIGDTMTTKEIAEVKSISDAKSNNLQSTSTLLKSLSRDEANLLRKTNNSSGAVTISKIPGGGGGTTSLSSVNTLPENINIVGYGGYLSGAKTYATSIGLANSPLPNMKYSMKTGTGKSLQVNIICTTCTIDFK